MLKLSSSIVVALLSIFSFTAIAAHPHESDDDSSQSDESAFDQRDLDLLLAPIKSTQDLLEHLSTDTDSPLDELSSSARWSFIDSLRFNETGLTSYRYDVLEQELTLTEAYRVLQLFGAQSTITFFKNTSIETEADEMLFRGHVSTPQFQSSSLPGIGKNPPGEGGDHEGYLCYSRATCSRADGYICKSNC